MRWQLKQRNILDQPAKALICSANVHLTLSGGVGAELLGRYGPAMQRALHAELKDRSPRCARRGEVFAYTGAEVPYRVVLHAVAIDGWYESSTAVITEIVQRALEMAALHQATTVALTALATGFGRLTFAGFAEGIRPLLSSSFPFIEEVVLCVLLDFELAELERHLPELGCLEH